MFLSVPAFRINPGWPVTPVYIGQAASAQAVTSANNNSAPLVPASNASNQSSQTQGQNQQSQNQQSQHQMSQDQSSTTHQKGFHLNSSLTPKKLTTQDLRAYSDRKVAETHQTWQKFQHTKIGHRLAYEIDQTRICAKTDYGSLQENEHWGKVLPDLEKRSKRRKQKKEDPTSRMTPDELSEYRADHALPPSAEEIARNPNAEKHDTIQLEMIRENPWNSHLFTHPEVERVPQNSLWHRMSENLKIKSDHQWEQTKTQFRHQYHHANDNSSDNNGNNK